MFQKESHLSLLIAVINKTVFALLHSWRWLTLLPNEEMKRASSSFVDTRWISCHLLHLPLPILSTKSFAARNKKIVTSIFDNRRNEIWAFNEEFQSLIAQVKNY